MPDTPQRIALIVVHGVADQRPGETAQSVIDLLVAAPPAGVAYAAKASESFTLPVEPMQPQSAPASDRPATPEAADRSASKSFAQSLRSDFQRDDWKAPDSPEALVIAMRKAAAAGVGTVEVEAPDVRREDRGIRTSTFLLSKHVRNGARPESFTTARTRLERHAAGATPARQQVDVFEMYWADLSRLSGAVPRIVTEFFTMIFRLSKLARDTVDEARRAMEVAALAGGSRKRGYAAAWSLTAWLHIGLDWLFVNGLALLMLQLALLGVLLLAIGGLDHLAPATLALVHDGVAAALCVVAALLAAYRWRDPRLFAPPLATLLATAAIWALAPSWRPWITVMVILAAVTAALAAGLRVADERFPLVRLVGRVMWAVLFTLLLGSVVVQLRAGAAHDRLETWLRATLFDVEVTLLTIKWWWIIVAVLLVVWMLAGIVAARERGYESSASVASGRLGLGLSIGAFLATSMAIWSMLSGALATAVDRATYVPCLFVAAPTAGAATASAVPPSPSASGAGTALACPRADPCAEVAAADPAPRPASAADEACLWTTRAVLEHRPQQGPLLIGARPYLQQRYENTTASFAQLTFVVLSLLSYLVAMFVPSILAEMQVLIQKTGDAARAMARRRQPDTGSAARLPRIGGGAAHQPGRDRATAALQAERAARTRRLGRWLSAGYRHLDDCAFWIFLAGVALGAAVGLSFYGVGWFARFEQWTAPVSRDLLRPLVLTAASIVAVLVAFGGLLSKYLPSLRGPLDIALDVDNHFREFPRTGIPRARIFSRYAALLREVAAGRYERIVIVAHSQGSVISTELLRYLSSDGRHEPGPHAQPSLDGAGLAPIHLLTLGCPLRQLYAARFPTLYRWVLERHGSSVSGPRAADIGVVRWINGFCSGDYVGRWLWSDHRDDADDPLGHPMVDAVDATLPERFGRSDAYAGFDPTPPAVAPFDGTREVEVCLGLGAHTHYFEPEQRDVAWLIDKLLVG